MRPRLRLRPALPAEVQLGLHDHTLDMGHARALLSLDDPKLQLKLYNE
ncbi:MAG: hypothetical protein II671_01650, partial [Salinivirgaceae bacterium]|nr:hypothetical protein [Salinivirgaceae bacterium]